ncbi:MAG: SP_1767 family glycosyltransferase [Bacteroidales bacterium]|jgi:glycosyltransferase family protein|nr:SP_1767 family glycosyltransferase [Bacteroidales bacterium]
MIEKIIFKLRYGSAIIWYSFLYFFRPYRGVQVQVASIDETVQRIIDTRCSVSRYGDGELRLIGKEGIGFQQSSNNLAEKLATVLQSREEGHIVCIPDIFTQLNRYRWKAAAFWKTNLYLSGYLWDTYLTAGYRYYNAFMTRPYIDWRSKSQSATWFHLLKKIWQDRNIIFIEGARSRLGTGNDLFDGAKSIRRIICPSVNAFSRYNEILHVALGVDDDALFLIALGPTASVLAYDLFKAGRQAIDCGHVDIEYEWFLMNAKRKVPVPSKHVNELPYIHNHDDRIDEKYLQQIIKRIK